MKMELNDLLSEKKKNHFYIMHLSYEGKERRRLWDFANKNNLIGLDYHTVVKNDWDEVRDNVKDQLPGIWVKQFDIFCYELEKYDIILVMNGWLSLLGIAEITKKTMNTKESFHKGVWTPFLIMLERFVG